MRCSTLLTVVVLVVVGVAGCRPGPLDYEEDWSEEVERICSEYCDIYVSCAPEPWFDSHEECMTSELGCLGADVMYWDSECGAAWRDNFQCVADATTCDEYDAATDIHADEYPCKAVNDHASSLKCGQQDPP